jgi:hypothetical protein
MTPTSTPRTDTFILRQRSGQGWADFARQLERELGEAKEDAKQGWQEFERMRALVPTTAQVMVYHSLLMKHNQWKQCAGELVLLVPKPMHSHAACKMTGEECLTHKTLTHFNQLKTGVPKMNGTTNYRKENKPCQ